MFYSGGTRDVQAFPKCTSGLGIFWVGLIGGIIAGREVEVDIADREASSCIRGGLGWIFRKIPLPRGL